MQALQSVGMMLLTASQMLGGQHPVATPPIEILKIQSMQIVKDSLAEHRTGLFRFDYPEEETNSTWPGFAVRRGFPFNVSVVVDRELELDTQKFNIQSAAQGGEEERFRVVACHGLDRSRKSVEAGTYAYVVEVTTSVLDPAARYTDLTVSVGEDDDQAMFFYPFPVYVLYNPYFHQDVVYHPDAEYHKNYLEEEATIYFQGEASAVEEYHWYYGQFEPVMLEAAFDLLEGANASPKHRADPRETLRILSKVVGYWTESDPPQGNPAGILNGHWFDENFTGGTNPDDWVSSYDIVDQWYKGDKTPVSFGQCWVFAAVGRSLFASLGLVSRQVSGFGTMVDGSVTQYTNGVKAHAFADGKTHHVVMFFFDKTGEMRYQWGMVWNFHSWSEVYFNEPEKERAEFGGWHVVDPTLPGEGPASVRAIHDLVENVDYNVTDMIGDLHSTRVYKLVKCSPEVDAHKLPANATTCPEVKTLEVFARGAPFLLTSSSKHPQERMDITVNYVNHSVDAFVPLDDGTKPYPEALAQASLDKVTTELVSLPVVPEEPTGALKLTVRAVSEAVVVGRSVRVVVEVQAPQSGEARTVDVNVAGDILRINSPKRLASVVRHSSTIVLSKENDWRASVPVTVSLEEMIASGELKLGPFRHVVEFGVVAIDQATQDIQFDRSVVLLKNPKAQVKAPERLIKVAIDALARGANRKLGKDGVSTAAPTFDFSIVSPFVEEVQNVCVKINTLHSTLFGMEGKHCFEKLSPGETVKLSKELNDLTHVAPGVYPISFAISAPSQPTSQYVHSLFIE